jgi:predicted O-methyltransferase YrrM
MIKESLRQAAYSVAPRAVVDRYLHHKMARQARDLNRLRAAGADASLLIEPLWRSNFFRPLQKKSEILRLLAIVRAARPEVICEIGAAGGGTTFLLAHAAAGDATIISLDLAYSASRRAAVHSFAREEQKIICLPCDSHSPLSVRAVKAHLARKRLDILFLDGDHSYEGVKTDFQFYSPLVRPGGLVIFHDIVPDYKARYGIQTSSDSGGVPRFWKETKASGAEVEEVVEDYEQDGFGIGILHWSDAAS